MPPSKANGLRTTLRTVGGDFIVSLLFVLCTSMFGEAAGPLSKLTGLAQYGTQLGITLFTVLVVFDAICNQLGGAMFNPVHNVAMIATGKGDIAHNALRVVAQLLGGLAGSAAAFVVLPPGVQTKLPLMVAGTQPGVSLLEGVLCEVVLGIVINQMFLLAAAPPPPGAASIYPQRLSLATILATLIPVNLVGARFTGPCLNPIVAFAWYWHFSEKLALREHLLLFWLGPFAGAVLSGPLYNWATGTKRGAPGTKAKQRTSSRLRKAD